MSNKRDYLRARLDDMHLYRNSHEAGIQLLVAAFSTAAGIWLPRYLHPGESNVGSACFMVSLGILVNVFLADKRKKYLPGKLLTVLCYVLSCAALVVSFSQIVAGSDDIGEHSQFPYKAIKVLLIAQGIDWGLQKIVDPADITNESIAETDAEKILDTYRKNEARGKMGNVDKGGEDGE